jgi:hypothetical protein
MSNNTTLPSGTGGDTIRDLDRQSGGVKTQVTQLDIGGASTNAEILVTAGQQTMAASVPVVLASNQTSVPVALAAGTNVAGKVGIDQTTPGSTNRVQLAPPTVSGTISAANANLTSGVATASSTVAIGPLGDASQLSITTVGTFSGTLQVQVSNDNSNWESNTSITGITKTVTGVQTATIVNGGTNTYEFNNGGSAYARVTCSAFTSGSLTVTVTAAASVGSLALDQPIPAGTNTIGAVKLTDGTNTATVKAASTAAVAADPALVVAISPNNTVPTNTSQVGTTSVNAFPAGFQRVTDEPTQIFYDPFDAALDTTNLWTTPTVGNSAVLASVTTGNMSMGTGTTASGWSKLTSATSFKPVVPAWIGYSFAIQIPDAPTPTANSYRFWGAGTLATTPTTAAPLTDAVGFELTTAGALCAVVYAGGTRTLIATLTSIADASMHRYIVYIRTDKVYWYIDGLGSTNLVATSNFQAPQVQTLPISLLAVGGSTPPASNSQIVCSGLAVWDTGKNGSQLVDGTYPWRKATIKPASTAPLATDPALVVTLNPNVANNIVGPTNITVADTNNSTTSGYLVSVAPTAGSYVALALTGTSYAVINLGQQGSGYNPTLNFEMSPDSTNGTTGTWVPFLGSRIAPLASSSVTSSDTVTSGYEMYEGSCKGMTYIRVRCTSFPVGANTQAVTIYSSNHDHTGLQNVQLESVNSSLVLSTYSPDYTGLSYFSLTSAGATGSINLLGLDGTHLSQSPNSLLVELQGTWVGAVQFYGSNINYNNFATENVILPFIKVGQSNGSTTPVALSNTAPQTIVRYDYVTENGSYRLLNTGGFNTIVVICTSYTSGTITGWFSASASENTLTQVISSPEPKYQVRHGFDSTIASGVDTAIAQVIKQAGGTATTSQSAGSLIVTSGVTANQETVVRSLYPVSGDLTLRYFVQLSQRIANNNFFVELVDVIGDGLTLTASSTTQCIVTIPNNQFNATNVGQSMYIGAITNGTITTAVPMRATIASVSGNNVTFTVAGWTATGAGTCSLFGLNYIQLLYTGTTATNVNYDTQRNGYNSGFTTATINTTASPGHIGTVTTSENESLYADQVGTSGTGAVEISRRASRTRQLPNPTKPLFLQIRSTNGTSAPASNTTLTVSFADILMSRAAPVTLTNISPISANSGIPTEIINTPTIFLGGGIALADGVANPTAAGVTNFPVLWNSATWDRQRSNYNVATGDTGTKTASFSGATQTNYNASGALITILLGTVSGTTPTFVAQLQGSPDGGTTWINIPGAATASIAATGNYSINCYPGSPTVAGAATSGNVASASYVLPRTWRVNYTIGGTTPSFALTSVSVAYVN